MKIEFEETIVTRHVVEVPNDASIPIMEKCISKANTISDLLSALEDHTTVESYDFSAIKYDLDFCGIFKD